MPDHTRTDDEREHLLRKEILLLTGYVAEDEPIPRAEFEMELSRLVARICSDQGQTLVRVSLIAVALARHIENA